MNKYLTLNSSKGLGYQIISRDAVNQTFVIRSLMYTSPNRYRGKSLAPKYYTELYSDSNYQLVVL